MGEQDRITIVGSGNWGTTLACLLAEAGRDTTLLVRTVGEASELRRAGENARYLPGVPLPPRLTIQSEMKEALAGCRLVLLAVPSQTMRQNVAALRPFLAPDTIMLSCAKGLERGSLLRMSEVIAGELGAGRERTGALSGPNIAREISEGKPAVSVVTTYGHAQAELAQSLLTSPGFRVYTSDDVVGVELAGALKNIIALGAGISDGMGAGDNAKAAFMTRGLAEIARLGRVLGANPLTFAGLAGLGDLVATCESPHSRNRRLGQALAEGLSLSDAQARLGQVAEGVTTVLTALELAARYAIEMPITKQLHAVLFEDKDVRGAIGELMQRDLKHELAGLAGLL
jgi:glycerol-3-phosphate dehydrogenase (NAD(P)+)